MTNNDSIDRVHTEILRDGSTMISFVRPDGSVLRTITHHLASGTTLVVELGAEGTITFEATYGRDGARVAD